jgi:hypothetical protein
MLWLNVTTPEGSSGLVGQIALTGFGLVSAATVTLAFCPPARYVAWVRSREVATGGEGPEAAAKA